jgi:hypothetical protein
MASTPSISLTCKLALSCVQVFPHHVRIRGPPNADTLARDRGLWFNRPIYTGAGPADRDIIYDSAPELQVREWQIVAVAVPYW